MSRELGDTSNYLTTGSTNSLIKNDNMYLSNSGVSFAAWIKVTNTATVSGHVVACVPISQFVPDDGDAWLWFYGGSGNPTMRMFSNNLNSGASFGAGTTITTSTAWHHVGITFTQAGSGFTTTATFYLDGVTDYTEQVVFSDATGGTNSSGIRLGTDTPVASDIAHLRIAYPMVALETITATAMAAVKATAAPWTQVASALGAWTLTSGAAGLVDHGSALQDLTVVGTVTDTDPDNPLASATGSVRVQHTINMGASDTLVGS